jgi:hypothetical protein
LSIGDRACLACGRPQVAPTAAPACFTDDVADFLPRFSGAGEGVHACSADSIATEILGFRA